MFDYVKNGAAIHFNPAIAAAYGVEEAVIFDEFLYQIETFIRKKQHCHAWAHIDENGVEVREPRTWVYDSATALVSRYPFWSESQIRRTLKRMAEKGLIVTGNFNKRSGDRTTWYALRDEANFLRGIAPNTETEVRPSNEIVRPSNEIVRPSNEIVRPLPLIFSSNVIIEEEELAHFEKGDDSSLSAYSSEASREATESEAETLPQDALATPPSQARPTEEEAVEYAMAIGQPKEAAIAWHRFTKAGDWKDSTGKSIRNWKRAFLAWKPRNGIAHRTGKPKGLRNAALSEKDYFAGMVNS